MTGATGFLGSELLRRVLSREADTFVHVLVRGVDEASAGARLDALLDDMFSDPAERQQAGARVRAVHGDVGADRLGLDEGTFRMLAESITDIYHLGRVALRSPHRFPLSFVPSLCSITRKASPMNAIVRLLASLLALWALGSSAHADVTPAELAGQPAIMKTDCRNRLGKAGESSCTTAAAYQACAAYLKQGHWEYCVQSGVANSQMRRWNAAMAADVDKQLLANHCVHDIYNSLECADEDFNLAHGYAECVSYHNAGMPQSCKLRKFLPEFAQRVADAMKGKSVGWAFTVIDRDGQVEERAEGPARRAPDTKPGEDRPDLALRGGECLEEHHGCCRGARAGQSWRVARRSRRGLSARRLGSAVGVQGHHFPSADAPPKRPALHGHPERRLRRHESLRGGLDRWS